MAHSPDDLFAFLAEHKFETTTVDHEPVFTVEESRHLRGQIAGAHTKNLFLRDNKKAFFLVTVEENRTVDLKHLRPLIGARGGLSFASTEALHDHLGIRPGSVSPFAAYSDKAGVVTVVVDADLLHADVINCHPLTNEKTTSIKPADLLAFLRATGHEPVILTLDKARPAGD